MNKLREEQVEMWPSCKMRCVVIAPRSSLIESSSFQRILDTTSAYHSTRCLKWCNKQVIFVCIPILGRYRIAMQCVVRKPSNSHLHSRRWRREIALHFVVTSSTYLLSCCVGGSGRLCGTSDAKGSYSGGEKCNSLQNSFFGFFARKTDHSKCNKLTKLLKLTKCIKRTMRNFTVRQFSFPFLRCNTYVPVGCRV